MNRLSSTGITLITIFSAIVSFADVDHTTYAGYTNITGGSGGKEVTVTNTSDLIKHAKSSDKMIIKIKGKLSGAEVTMASNKTILGIGTDARLDKSTIKMTKGVSNIIIRNITINFPQAPGKDIIQIEGKGTSKIWIDHCELYNATGDVNGDGKVIDEGDVSKSDKDYYDGIVDITKGGSNVTVSWCYIHDSYKTSLIGSSDNDINNWNVTYHHNIFNNSGSRLPSIRGGSAVIFNNFYVDIPSSGINSRMGAQVMAENNYFLRVGSGKIEKPLGLGEGPIGAYYSKTPGKWNVKGNKYVDCKGSQPTESTTNFKAPFDYSKILIPTEDVPSVLAQYAGIVGKKKSGFTVDVEKRKINRAQSVKMNSNVKNSTVYTITGKKIGSAATNNAIAAHGIYITKVGNASFVNLTPVE